MSFNTVGGFGPQLLFLNRLDMYIGCSCHVCLCMTCALSCLFYAKLQTFLHSRKICKQKLCLLTFERMGEDGRGRASGWREPRGKPRGTVAMREEAGRERMREDGRGWERTGEDGRGWERMGEDGESGGWREPRGKPRGTVAMREEAGWDGRGWERRNEDERGLERTGEDERG